MAKQATATKQTTGVNGRFAPRIAMSLEKQLNVALAALRERADDQGNFSAPPGPAHTILTLLQPFGANEDNARNLQGKLVAYGLLTYKRKGQRSQLTAYTVDMVHPPITPESLKKLQSDVRARKRLGKASTNGTEPELTLEQQLEQIAEIIAGYELALDQLAAGRDQACAELEQEKAKSADLQRRLDQAEARYTDLEQFQQRAGSRAREMLARYPKVNT